MRVSTLIVCSAALAIPLVAEDIPRVAFDIKGGFTTPKGQLGNRTDSTGWNIGAGVGYNFSSYVSLMGQFDYNGFGINRNTLNNLNFPDGRIHVTSFTLEPLVHLLPRNPVDIYVTGGGGLYRVSQTFTQPGVAAAIGFDPFFGFYQTAVPVDQVLSSYSVNKPGWNAGVGFAVGTKWHGKIFAEARYSRVILGNNRHMDYVPVSFGFRW